MARIIYSALVESIQGSIKGTTFQRNAYGYTIKGKPNMVNPNTARQNARKRTFSNAAQSWRSLTPTQRSQWDAYANAFPIPSRKNPSSFLSGLNAFVRWHGVMFQANDTVLGNPSGAQGTAYVNQIYSEYVGVRLYVETEIVETNGPWLAFYYMTRPLQPTQSFVKSWARYIKMANDSDYASVDVTDEYVRVFGALPPIGSLVGIQVVLLNTTNGQVMFGTNEIVTIDP